MAAGELLDPDLKARAAYARAFGTAALGFVFTLVDLRIGLERQFDLVPDVVGYLLFLSAAGRLRGLHPWGRSVHGLAIVLTGWSALLLLLELVAPGGAGPLLLALALVALALDVGMVWLLCGIVISVGRHLGDAALAAAAAKRRLLYLIFIALVATIPLIIINLLVRTGTRDLGGLVTLVFLAFVAAVALLVAMYALMRRAEHAIA